MLLMIGALLASPAWTGLASSAAIEPLARDDVFLIEWDGTQHELDVLSNDLGSGELIVVAIGPTTGSASIRPNEDGTLILFWPTGEFRGAETFTYTLVDGDGETSTGRVKVTEQFDYTLSGTKTWALSYGFGSGVLGGSGFSFTQSLSVDLWAEALGVLTVSAEFDDQKELKDQHLSVELDTEYVTGALGDFSLSGAGDLFVYNRTMTGVRVDVYPAGQSTTGPVFTAVASQLQGISRSITIVGESASATKVFSATDPDAPWEEASYAYHIDGLASYLLDDPFVRGIAVIEYAIPSSAELAEILGRYDLGPIAQAFEDHVTENPPLDSSFASLEDVQQRLVLKSDPRALLRTMTREAILDHNRAIAEGESAIDYPFVQGSDLESEFLNEVGRTVAFVVNEQSIPLLPHEEHRFYNLGHGGVDPETIVVEATSIDGTIVLSANESGDDEPNTYRLYAEAGFLELRLADSFFDDAEAIITATYSYAREGQLVVLDFGAVPDSVRVTLNGQPLEEGIGYEVDYTDPATLLILEEIGPADVVQIEYEQFRGGLGSPAEFATTFLGAQITFPIADVVQAQLSVLRSADIADGADEDPTLRTMPNAQTVVGFDASFDLDPLSGSLMLGYNDNVFPADDNVRPSLPNRITQIGVDPSGRWVLFAHYQGLTVFEDGEWETFGGSSGLASQRVFDLAVAGDLDRVYLATSAGLTVVDTTGETAFDRLDRWTNLTSDVGLPEGEIRAVALAGETIWVGGEETLARARWDEADLSEGWEVLPVPEIDPRVLVIGADGRLLVAGDNGAWWLDSSASDPVASMTPIASLLEVPVRDAAVFEDRVWIASDEGLAEIDPQGQFHWLLQDHSVLAVCAGPEGVFFAAEDGLYDLTLPEPLLEAEHLTSVACDDATLWAGQQAMPEQEYALSLWLLAASSSAGSVVAFGNTTTGIDGRDPLYYAELNPADHTSQGWMMRLGFRRDYGIADLAGSFTIQDPGFSAIGRIDRNDIAGWSVSMASGEDAYENLDYEISHEYIVSGRASTSGQTDGMQADLENRISVGFDFTDLVAALANPLTTDDLPKGPILRASLSHDASTSGSWDEDDGWNILHSLRVSDSLFALDTPVGSRDLLSVSLTSSGSIDDSLQRSAKLGASVAVTPPGAFSVDGAWNRRLSASPGSPATTRSESFSLSADWRPDLSDTSFTAEASYSAGGARTSQSADFTVDHGLSAELRLDARPLGGWMVTPRFEADASFEQGTLGFELQASTPLQTGSRSLRPSVSLDVSGLGELRTESEQRFDVSYYDRSSDTLQPSLSSSLRRTTVSYLGSKATSWSLTLTPRLEWSPVPELDTDLHGSMTATFSNEQWTITGSLRGNADSPLTALFPALAEFLEQGSAAEEGQAALASDLGSDAGAGSPDVVADESAPGSWLDWIGASNVSANLSGNGSLRSGRWSFGTTARTQISTSIGDSWSTGISLQGELSKLADLDTVDTGWLIEIHVAVRF